MLAVLIVGRGGASDVGTEHIGLAQPVGITEPVNMLEFIGMLTIRLELMIFVIGRDG